MVGVLIGGGLTMPLPLYAQTQPTTTAAPQRTDTARSLDATADLRGRPVEDVRILGVTQVSPAIIRNVIRTRAGEPFDPVTVVEDYQRIFDLKKFANVEARVEPTDAGGVIVAFQVTERDQINQIRFVGNQQIDTETLDELVDLEAGQAIDMFRVALARQAIERLYQDRNHPHAEITVDQDELMRTGDLVFRIVEGPNVRVRKVNFVGNTWFTDERLEGVAETKNWVWVLDPGTYDPSTVEDDIGRLTEHYRGHGFFDVRVGRKVIVSPDLREIQVDFIIDEGPRYRIGEVRFQGNANVSDEQLREELNLKGGEFFNADVLRRDVRQIVREYSPLGYIYQPEARDPDYLRVDDRQVFGRETGVVDLVYEIREGKPFRLGRIQVRGNTKTQDKVILREMRVAPGQLYNSAEVQDAMERLRGTPYFMGATATPIGSDPEFRDLLVEVTEAHTATLNFGAGINSNGGVGGSIVYEQKNFDAANWPNTAGEIFTDRAFVGAGQSLRISLEPGTEQTNASVRFTEPWIFDYPYSFSGEAYYRNRERRDYDDTRAGGRIALGKRFDHVWSGVLSLRGEDVEISDIEDPEERAQEILDLEGHSTLTSAGIAITRNTTNRGVLPWRGTDTTVGWDHYGALGGEFHFDKFTLEFSSYHTLYEDLLERRTILNLHLDAGYIEGDAPFFERFYAGGLGSVRGFRFRGISPRSGLDDDAVGGDFSITGTAELSFPVYGENLRGVVFVDAGTAEEEFEIDTLRSAVGAGIRLTLPILGQAPLALDFAYPLVEDDEDDTQVFSFSFGLIQ